jgi:membrane protein DedA with SNARE-associated domain
MLFAWAFVVQAGMPAPAVPMLVGAGALSGSGRMDFALAISGAMAATAILIPAGVLPCPSIPGWTVRNTAARCRRLHKR